MTKRTKEKRNGLSKFERETIINFNEAESDAYVFTYSAKWQKRLEEKLDLKPIMDNGFGGKEYKLSKKLISMPRIKRVPKKLSDKEKKVISERFKEARKTKKDGEENK